MLTRDETKRFVPTPTASVSPMLEDRSAGRGRSMDHHGGRRSRFIATYSKLLDKPVAGGRSQQVAVAVKRCFTLLLSLSTLPTSQDKLKGPLP